MGCDIHSYTEIKKAGKWERVDFAPFDYRSYGVYGFLANVRNYSAIPSISEARGLPDDVTPELAQEYEDQYVICVHSPSWLSLAELQAFDYDAEIEDRRYTKQTGPNSRNGGATCEPGEGERTTMREFLHDEFFKDLERLAEIGQPQDVRIVFWFDN